MGKRKVSFDGMDTVKRVLGVDRDSGYGSITQPKSQKDNLCLFYAIFNVLGEDQRLAFAKGNLENPAAAFVEMCESYGKDKEDGYAMRDIECYMQKLQFRWHRIRGYRLRRLKTFRLEMLWNNSRHNMVGQKIILFGTAGPKDDRTAVEEKSTNAVIRKVKRGELEQANIHDVVEAFVEEYKSRGPKFVTEDCPGHAIGVRYDMVRGSVLSMVHDAAKQTVKPLTIRVLCSSLITFAGVAYAVEIYLN